MKKSNKTNAILERHFNGWRDGYIGARMAIIDVTAKGLNKIPSDKQIESHYKKAEAEYEKESHESTDENGHKTFSFRIMSFDFEKEVALCSAEIRRGLADGSIEYADFFACAHEFYK